MATNASLLSALPTPAREYVVWKDEDKRKAAATSAALEPRPLNVLERDWENNKSCGYSNKFPR